MSNALTIVGVKNTKEELSSMPLRASIQIQLSKALNLVDADKSVKLLRLRLRDGVKSLPESFSDFKTNDWSSFEDVVLTQDGDTLIVKPKDSYREQSEYRLYVTSGLKGLVSSEYPTQIKSVKSSSQASISIEPLTEVELDGNSKRFVGSVYVHGGDPNTGILYLGQTNKIGDVEIEIAEDAQINVGEMIEILSQDEYVLADDFSIPFYTVASHQYAEPEIKSERISKDDIQKFFGNPLFNLDKTEAPEEEIVPSITYTTKVVLPNKIVIDLSSPIDPESTKTATVEMDISEAFGNYHLGKMGYYKEQNYIVEAELKKLNKQIVLTIEPSEEIQENIFRWKHIKDEAPTEPVAPPDDNNNTGGSNDSGARPVDPKPTGPTNPSGGSTTIIHNGDELVDREFVDKLTEALK